MGRTWRVIQNGKSLRQALGPRMFWLKRLCDRMNCLGIDQSGEVFIAARHAYDAMHSLGVLAHYRSRESGVCEQPATE